MANTAGHAAVVVDDSADRVTGDGARGGRPELAPDLEFARRLAAAAAATLLPTALSLGAALALPAVGPAAAAAAAAAGSPPAVAASQTGVGLAFVAMRFRLGLLVTGGGFTCMAVGGCVLTAGAWSWWRLRACDPSCPHHSLRLRVWWWSWWSLLLWLLLQARAWVWLRLWGLLLLLLLWAWMWV